MAVLSIFLSNIRQSPGVAQLQEVPSLGKRPHGGSVGIPAAPLQQWRRDFCHLENPKKETMNFPSAWHSKQGNPFSVTMDDTSHVLGRFHDFKWNDIIARVLGALHQG
jgi:hypothetical protein